MSGITLSMGIRFSVFELSKTAMSETLNSGKARAQGVHSTSDTLEHSIVTMLSGTLAGLVATTATYPLEVLRRRLQVSNSNTNLVCMFRKVYSQGRLRALYTGLLAECCRVAPGATISLCAFDFLKVTL